MWIVITGERGEIQWTGDWISFIDTMMQMTLLSKQETSLQLPTELAKIAINPERHYAGLWKWTKNEEGDISLP